jgi:putative transposase
MIRDRGSNFTAAFDAILAGASIRTVLCNVQTSRMNAIAERWTGGCRRELLDRTLIWNQAHLLQILRQHETHHNQHRPHRSLNSAAPLKPLPEPVNLDQHRARRQTRTGGLISEYHLVASGHLPEWWTRPDRASPGSVLKSSGRRLPLHAFTLQLCLQQYVAE